MKKLLPIAALGVLALAGCTEIGVNNPTNTTAIYSMGALTTSYAATSPDYIENIFKATNKALDQLGYYRTGETPGKDRTTVFARAHGDIKITVDIAKKIVETKEGAKQEWIDVVVRYGTWGNAKESQVIVSKISDNLFR